MSRRTNYTVKLGRSGLQFKIALTKSYDEKTGFTQTYPDPDDPTINRTVRTIKVITKEGVRPADPSDIRIVVPWTEVQSSFTYRDDDGKELLIPIDSEVIGKIYKTSEFMNTLGFIDSSEIAPCDYEGSHYFLTVQKDSKTKVPDPNDVKAYSTVFYICKTLQQHLLVTFVSGDREKVATLYVHRGCLMMSVLIHSTYQRKTPVVDMEALPLNIEILSKKLVAAYKLMSLPADSMEDKYEARVTDYIKKSREQVKATGVIQKITLRPVPKRDEHDFFSMLESM